MNTNFTTRFAVAAAQVTTLSLIKTAGDAQTGNPGQALSNPLEVEVRNANGAPLSGVTVTFEAASGGGVVAPLSAATDTQGRARTAVYLGNGATQTFTASMSSLSVTFTAFLSDTIPGAPAQLTFFHAQGRDIVADVTGQKTVFRGVNLNGLEFSDRNQNPCDRREGTDYFQPRVQDYQAIKSSGFNVIRVPFEWGLLKCDWLRSGTAGCSRFDVSRLFADRRSKR